MEQIKMGFVGLRFGSTVLDSLPISDSPVRLCAVCDTDPVKLESAVKRYGVPGYADMNEMLARADIDAVGLYTPPGGRAELMAGAIDAGKHIMTTKPFELDPQKARQILLRARGEGIVISMNSPGIRENEYIRAVREAAEQYDLGRPVAARFDEWVNYRETADGGWYDSEELCPAAPITRLGIYMINDLARLFGKAERVNILTARLLTGRPTADNAALGILYQNGVIANVFVSFCVDDGQRYKSSLTINYEKGSFYLNTLPMGMEGADGPEMLLAIKKEEDKTDVKRLPLSSRAMGEYDWEEFRGAIKNRAVLPEKMMEHVINGVEVIAAMGKANSGDGVAVIR